MAQELLITFSTMLGEVALIPGSSAVFKVHVDGGSKIIINYVCINNLIRPKIIFFFFFYN